MSNFNMNLHQEIERQSTSHLSNETAATISAYERLLIAKDELSTANAKIAELSAQVERLSTSTPSSIPQSKVAQLWNGAATRYQRIVSDSHATIVSSALTGLGGLFLHYYKENPPVAMGYLIVALYGWTVFCIMRWMVRCAVRKTLAAKRDHGWSGFYNLVFFYSVLLAFSGIMMLITDSGHGCSAQSLWVMSISLVVGGFAFLKGHVHADENDESFPNIRTINKYV